MLLMFLIVLVMDACASFLPPASRGSFYKKFCFGVGAKKGGACVFPWIVVYSLFRFTLELKVFVIFAIFFNLEPNWQALLCLHKKKQFCQPMWQRKHVTVVLQVELF